MGNETNDTTPPSLSVSPAVSNPTGVAVLYANSNDPEGVYLIRVYGPIEYTGLIRDTENCNYTTSCLVNLSFAYNPSYDTKGNVYFVEANSRGGSAIVGVNITFKDETNQTCVSNVSSVCINKECGSVFDQTCWLWVSCGTCPSGQTCNANGQCIVSNQTNQSSCTDTDGGINYLVKGSVKINGEEFGTDNCWNYDPNNYGFCEGNGAGCVLKEHYCENGVGKAETYDCPYGCSNGACIASNTTLTGVDYSVELISATDTSAILKVSSGSTSETKEIIENTWSTINGLSTFLIGAGETPSSLLATTSYQINLSSSGPVKTTLNFVADSHSDNREFELISASDNYATIKVTNLNTLVSETKEIMEFSTKEINGVNVSVLFADENSLTIRTQILVKTFYLQDLITQPFCTDSDGGLNYGVKGIVMTNVGNFTDFCSSNSTRLLTEYSCNGTQSITTSYTCGYQCSDGKCIAKPKPICRKGWRCILSPSYARGLRQK